MSSIYKKRLSFTSSTTNSSSLECVEKRSRSCQFAKEVFSRVSDIVEDSPFLRTKPAPHISKHMARFERSEIQLGRKLGEGAFSVVYEIVGFDLQDEVNAGLSPRGQTMREQYQDYAVSTRTGKGRFVIKQLKPELMEKPNLYLAAATDMAVEAAFLMRLDHENILPLRGLPVNGIQSIADDDGFFIILDRLEDTLDGRIREWQTNSSAGFHADSNTAKTKFEYSQQLASALAYLHQRRLVFRDLKPQNIGIDRTGKLRLFDFGLCRELPPQSQARDDLYIMSGGTGTRRYMAPEVALHQEYNCKVDVYSWSIVVWQMFSLAKPYSTYGKRDHSRYVCSGHERPPLGTSVPKALQSLLKKAWVASLTTRPSMNEVIPKLARARSLANKKQESEVDMQSLTRRILRRHSFGKGTARTTER